MIKRGLKLWTTNQGEVISEAKELLDLGRVDFLELYYHPDSKDWSRFKIFRGKMVTIHATHYDHGFDLMSLNEGMLEIYKDKILPLADYFESPYIILHPGVRGNKEKFSANLDRLYDQRLIIENMPKVSLDGQNFFGYSLDELKWIKEEKEINFCLDIPHAIVSANRQNIDYKKFIDDLALELKPAYFHISGVNIKSKKDEHLNLWEADFDLAWVKSTLEKEAENKEVFLVFEVPKVGASLKNDLKNIEYFRDI
ncbi:MAG: TIM barrel protein [Patescibacteria group bacterium]|jgi:sugar phosphate isomerase/epimerase